MLRSTSLLLLLLTFATARAADTDTDKQREEVQRALNERVMASAFNPGDIKRAEAYAEQAKREGVKPVPQPPTYWAPGWTCANLTVYPAYVFTDYRNCIYYYHYYGRYWP